jgi:queuine tRNA-ribosyltransferase
LSAKRFEVVQTRHGGVALSDTLIGEVMHPGVGALEEARVLYLEQSRLVKRLLPASGSPLVLFDVGLGAGTNAALAWNEAYELHQLHPDARFLHIISFEWDLAPLATALSSDHKAAFGLQGAAEAAVTQLLSKRQVLTPFGRWELREGDVTELLPAEPALADLVYFDLYSPQVAPAPWSIANLSQLRCRCKETALLVTYSASTAVRSAFLLAGFAVGRGVPIGTRRETTCAALLASTLDSPLDSRFLARLERSTAPFPPDAPADALDRIRRAAQFQQE